MDVKIEPGDIIEGPRWTNPVEVNQIDEMGDYIRLVGVDLNLRIHIDQMIHKDEIVDFNVKKIVSDFSASPTDVFLALENLRYRFASMYDPLLAMNTSKVDPLPHQIDAVYGFVLKLPRIRFLIADDPGAGKTIMAGLILKELKLRNVVKRILIVCPGHLKDQWRRELKDRFEENFVIIDRNIFNVLYGENPWDRENQIITSIDFGKRDDVLPSIKSSHFDLIIVDEAHKMSAYQYGNEVKRTGRYNFGESLSKITEHLLFLTATPHKGDPENFRLFLDLLEPGYFSTKEMLEESIKNKDNPLFIRRVKEDMKDFEGKPLFLPRHVSTVPFNLGKNSPKEKNLYNKLSEYVKNQYNKALSANKKRNIGFAIVILQRRFASSIFALWRSLDRRRIKLEDILQRSESGQHVEEKVFDFDEIEDLSEEDRWKEEEMWETLSVAENRDELKKEIALIKELIGESIEIINNEIELKLTSLKRTLTRLNDQNKGEKILIFTESKDTLEYLEKRIRSWGYSVNTIHGGLKLEDRVNAEKVFKNETQVLVATEAAGEGINLQFCHLMINYDLPWNPNRLEQRMGRIHRYGQTKEVYVFNLIAEDTREGRVMRRVFEKLEEIKTALGSDKVFDVLSEVLYGKNLANLLVDAASNSRSTDEILKDLDIKVDKEYINQVKENLGESLATKFIDYTRIKEMAEKAKEQRLIPEYTEAFFLKAFSAAEGKIRELKDGNISIDRIPFDIKNIAEEENFKKSYGPLLKSYRTITFDKDKAFKDPRLEFISFGHPLFESVMVWVKTGMSNKLSIGASFEDPTGILDGTILYFDGEITDGKGKTAGKRLFSFYMDRRSEEVKEINPAFIWDVVEGKTTSKKINIDELKNKAMNRLIPTLEKYKKELLSERKRQADIKKKYGINSLEKLIIKLDGDLIGLQARKDIGDNVDLPIFNKSKQKSRYQNALKDLEETIQKESILTINTPIFIGAIRVTPVREVHPAMKRDDEIEKIGMDVTMEYERKNGRTPDDVAKDNLGYDIRSIDESGKKLYIEVKARARIGDVSLSQNEWFKAKRFGEDYYLYVVLDAATNPDLIIINDPANTLIPNERIESVRYLISKDDIIGKRGKVVL